MKHHNLFLGIDWHSTSLISHLNGIRRLTGADSWPYQHHCEMLVEAVKWKELPQIPNDLVYIDWPMNVSQLETVPSDLDELNKSGMMRIKLNILLTDFNV